MKAVLVVDMPDSCFHCPLELYSNQCGANHENTAGNANKRPSWCPLKPLSQKQELKKGWLKDGEEILEAYINGYNACLDEITGETE